MAEDSGDVHEPGRHDDAAANVRFQSLLDASGDGMLVLDRDGAVAYANSAAARLFGKAAGDLLGRTLGLPLVGGESAEVDLVRPSGQFVLAEMRAVEATWAGEFAWLVSLRDVTARKRYKRLLQAAFDALTAHVAVLDESGTIVIVNRAWREFAEYGQARLERAGIGVNYLAVCDRAPKDTAPEAAEVAAAIREALAGRCEERLIEYPCHSPDVERWFVAHITRTEGPDAVYVVVSHEDITERKRSESAAARTSARLHALMEATLEATRTGTPEAALEVLTHSAREIVGAHQAVTSFTVDRNWAQAITTVSLSDKYADWRGYDEPTDGSGIYSFVCEHNQPIRLTQEQLEAHPRFRGFGGAADRHPPMRGWLAVPLVGLDGRNLGLIQLSDRYTGDFTADDEMMLIQIAQVAAIIVEQRRGSQQLARVDRQMATIFESITDAFFSLDREWRFVHVNARAEELLRKTRGELLGRGIWDVFPDAIGTAYFENYYRAMTENVPVSFEAYFGRLDLWTEVNAYPAPEGLTVFLRDVGERKRAVEALRASEARLTLALETARMGIWDWKIGEGEVMWSGTIEEIHGLEPGTFGGSYEDFLELVHPDDRDAVIAAMNRAVADADELHLEFRIVRPDGKVRWLESRGRLERDDDMRPVKMFGTVVDVTDRKDLEAQFRQAQKMEAVGRLAGGVAHDFNNLLTVISGYCELALRKLIEGDPLRENLTEIHRAAESASALTRQLLAFSRKQILAMRVLDLNATVENMDKMLRRLIGEDVELQTHLAPNLRHVRFDLGQLEQIVVNLAVNARDAMPDGGRLTIETHNVDIDDEYASHRIGIAPGAYVQLAVSDSGVGMSEEVRSRIFEPFFTTKDAGKGTGLGLSTVYGIVSQSGGHITVYSELGQGATFKIYLPAVAEEATEPERKPQHAENLRGTETVLVVEDEDGVRTLASRALEEYGYTVLEARNGGEALLTCENYAGEIDLMVTDVVMPQMSGSQLAARVSGLRPTMKVLYVSGYAEDAIVRHGILADGIAFLSKPYTPHSLGVRVREVLDGSR